MTQVIAVVGRTDFEAAITAARTLGASEPLTGLAAPLGRTAMALVENAWYAVEKALRCAYERGVQSARTLIDEAVTAADEALQAAQDRVRDVHDALLEKLQAYVETFVDGALQRVRANLRIHGRELALTSVELSQSISLSGSLKASIQEICSLSGEGQVTLTASYGAPAG